ncbi:alpha/beta fold hydrolase, partial [Streptomyces sp. DSM 41534]
MTEFELKKIDTSAGTLRYYDTGGDGPVLLFLHGSGPGVTGWRNFHGILPTFARQYRCLILEFPGFGVTDDIGGHPMVTAQSVVGPFLDSLDIDLVDIVGNSMGGGVGLNFAIHQPDRVGKLVTIGGIGTNVFSPGPSEGIRLLQ